MRASRQRSDTKRKDSIERRRRIQQQARTASLFRRLTLAVSIVTVLGFLALLFAGWQWKSARNHLKVAEKLRLEAVAKKEEIEKVNKILEKTNDELRLKDAALEMSSALRQAYASLNAGKLDEAETQFQGLLKDYEGKSDHEAVARTHSTLGEISLKRGHHASAIGRYDKALAILNKDEKLLNSVGQAYIRKGGVYFNWGKRKEEQAEYKDALGKYNNSFGFYQRAIDIFRKTKNRAGTHDAKNGFDDAKRLYDALKEKLESQAVLNQDTSAP